MKKIVAIFSALLLTTGMAEIGCTYEEPAALSNAVTEETVQFYQQWKEKYLAQDTYVTNETQYYVWYSEDRYKGDNQSVPVTVSEAHGYGMLIFASMAKYDASAKEYFDGMYRYYKAHPSSIDPHLMSWQQCDNGSALIDGAEDGKTYCGAVVLTITDNNLDTVTLDGKVVTLTDGKLTLEPKEGKQTVIAADKAGNKTTLIVTVNNGHTGDRAVATENEPVKCIYCGYVIAPALGHSCANHLNYVEAKVATTATEGNIAYWYCAVCDKYFSDENANNEIKKEDTIIAKLTPVIIKGDKATVSADEKKELSFTSDAIYEDFIRVEVDGKTVDESNYTVKSGSTIVTLKADYVASLSEGNHTLSIVSMSGTATAGFTINKKETETVEITPKTGDKNYPVFWISMFTCSIMALGLAAVTGRRKRKDI